MRPDLRVLGLTSWVVVHDSLSMQQIRKFPRPSLVLILDSLDSHEKILDYAL